MDARVTKQRLGNMLSYDWLKILCVIAAAVTLLVLFFTMVGVRPARAQEFIVHFYGDYQYGSDYIGLKDVLNARLSYDVLEVRTDQFGSGMMDGASFTARRSSGEGSVAIASDYAEEGEESPFRRLVQQGFSNLGTPNERFGMFYKLDEYFAGLEEYLARFFGEDWKSGEIDRAEAEVCFRARNVDGPNNKNRYRSEEQIAQGVEDEVARLNALRNDYVYLLNYGLNTPRMPYVAFTSEIKSGEETVKTNVYTVGINLGSLTRIGNLVAYAGEGNALSREKLNFLIYDNGEANYENGTNDGRGDLKFEAVTCLKYLVEQYQ